MSEYNCDQCGREFSSDEYRALQRVPVNPEGPGNTGYHAVCGCGSEFYEDNWATTDHVNVDGEEIRVHTYFLILNHGHDGEDLWYETLVRGQPEGRYETREAAEARHEEIVQRLEAGDCHFEPTGKRLVLGGES